MSRPAVSPLSRTISGRKGQLWSQSPQIYPVLTFPRARRCGQARYVSSVPRVPSAPQKLDDRARLSALWAPTGGIAAASNDSHSLLIRAGFLRQAHSGIFHMLPLGRRVQDKLEKLIDKYMAKLGSSKVDLSSISSEKLWERSGRLGSVGSELFRFKDRKEAGYLLSPTHEEEITSLVASSVKSYKELPIRLYQISRKYRDELRPRHGLLRSREFIMKDLYTFDSSVPLALSTYEDVRKMYSALFDELKIPYLVAEADSGDMGGNLSHEFHFPTSKGEDHVISCAGCGYVANEELAESPPVTSRSGSKAKAADELNEDAEDIKIWRASDGAVLADAPQVNLHAIKALYSKLDTSIEIPPYQEIAGGASPQAPSNMPEINKATKLINIVDGRLFTSNKRPEVFSHAEYNGWNNGATSGKPNTPALDVELVAKNPSSGERLNVLRIRTGDACPRCPDGTVKVQEAIELGHTFHLGTRYSQPLNASVMAPLELIRGRDEDYEIADEGKAYGASRQVAMQMGCHGIGVSRMIGAVADTLADEKGLNWPRVMAPYEVVVVPTGNMDNAAVEVYDELAASTDSIFTDLVLDDRSNAFSWKMRDADLVGYPIIVVVGKRWMDEKMVEFQCRRLNVCEHIHIDELAAHVNNCLAQL
ncbi:prolyl-tRNA synthetase-like protein [Halenospora varia]|nr:prolyl-tRNA synthetase-like protein [Halenospora varia]